MLEDNRIIELFFARDEQAIAAVSEKYGTSCGCIARNILKNESDAEECVNDTYLALWNAIPPAHPNPLRTYIFRIVRNIAAARYHANSAQKRNSHYDVVLEELEDCLAASSSVDEEMEAGRLSEQLDVFLSTLEKRDRTLFVRRYWYSDSIEALAQRFRMSENHVSVRLFRLREKLKKHLEKGGFYL